MVDNLLLAPLDIASPYLDTATLTVTYFVTTAQGYFTDLDTSLDQKSYELLKFQRLHINNPAWAVTVDDTPVISQDIGDGVSNFGLPGVANVFVEIGTIPAYADFWWDTDEFAKMGVFNWATGGIPINGAQFINYPVQQFDNSANSTAGFKIILLKDFDAHVEASEFYDPGPILFSTGSGFGAFISEDPAFHYSSS